MLKSDTSESITHDGDDCEEVTQELLIGLVVGGKYAIKRLLGTGGNGAVYEGEHQTVGHRVAIKVVHRALADRQDIMARYQREARICGTLRHRHVGQVYDFGTLDDGAPYIVMELHEGRSLADVLSDTRLPIAAIIHITQQLVDGLGAAHRFGAAHRDIKPENVMIVRDHSGEVVVKLVDFGISKSLGQRAERSVTLEGVIVGSPEFMSPEQLRGDEIDERTDIYSTGVLLYEAITGRLPFEHEKTADLVAAIMRDPFPAPTELRRDCPPELERIVLKAMSRDAAQRYQSADEMSRALAEAQRFLRNSSSVNLVYLSEPTGPPTDARASTPRRRTVDSNTLRAIHAQMRALGRRSRLMWTGIAGTAGVVVVLSVVAARMFGGSPEPEPGGTRAPAQVAPPALREPPSAVQAVVKQEPAAQEAIEVTAPAQEPAPAKAVTLATPVSTVPSPAGKERAANRSGSPRKAPEQQHARDDAPPGKPAGELPVAAPPDAETLGAMLKQAATAFALGQTAKARSLYLQIITAAPSHADAWRGLGLMSSRLGDRAEAARAFKRYLALRPNAVDADRIRKELEQVQ